MNKFLLFIASVVFVQNSFSQELPWASAPDKKSVFLLNDQLVEIHLVKDTLPTGDSILEQNNEFFKGDGIKLGYGYVDKDGNPHGIWKYFRLVNDKYELFAEGSMQKVSAANIATSEDLTDNQRKIDYIRSLYSPRIITGEWRFYRSQQIYARQYFDVIMKADVHTAIEFDDNGNVSREKKYLAIPSLPTGRLLYHESYNTDGSILFNTLYSLDGSSNSQHFEKGKAIMEPWE